MEVAARIERIGKHMVEIMLHSLQNSEMALERAQQIAQYYLSKIRTAGDHKELTTHVETMLTDMPEMHMVVRSDKMFMMQVQRNNNSVV